MCIEAKTTRGVTKQLADELQAGRVYRHMDLAHLSKSVDRHLKQLLSIGTLKKLAKGLYYIPKQSKFGPLPLTDEQVVRAVLRDNEFLVFSPSSYNTVGLGSTQLYNSTWVYNHKRHGVFKLGNRQFHFRVKPRFPKKLTPEFLYIDLLNNLGELAEDRDVVLSHALTKLWSFNKSVLLKALGNYGSMTTRKRVREWHEQGSGLPKG
jgi:hypothetical protein